MYGARKSKSVMVAQIPGIEESKYLMGNTLWYRIGQKQFWRLHDTDILTLENGVYTLNSGGWRTPTTKDRLNSFLPEKNRIFTEKGIWYYGTWNGGKIPFKDGMKVNAEGNTLTPLPELEKEGTERKALLKKIDGYVKKAKAHFLEKGIPKPELGDCFYCQMTVTEGKDKGKSLGEATGDKSHLLTHIEEGYIMGSLTLNAIRSRGYPNPAIFFDARFGTDTAIRSIRQYLKASLGV